jgi:tRNA(His) 5'-end guanylyltransferase
MDKTSLGDRMKGYEAVTQGVLMKRTPVIIRLDGKAFHTFTKRLNDFDDSLNESPFSEVMYHCMASTAVGLTHYIQGARIAYSQSDEISILCTDWATFDTQQWFAGKIQKIVSVSAAMAATFFYAAYENYEYIDYAPHRPLFDARVFNVPKEDVCNYFIWRQKDAIRNSINMLGQYHFPHRELQGKKVDEVRQMCYDKKQADWYSLPTWMQQGFCVESTCAISSFGPYVNDDIPTFTEDREYIEKWLDGDYQGEMHGPR